MVVHDTGTMVVHDTGTMVVHDTGTMVVRDGDRAPLPFQQLLGPGHGVGEEDEEGGPDESWGGTAIVHPGVWGMSSRCGESTQVVRCVGSS